MQHRHGYIDITDADWPEGNAASQFIAIYENGTALVARDHANDPLVRRVLRSAEQRLKLSVSREFVTLDMIAEARRSGMAGRRGGADKGMQGNILSLIEDAHSRGASDIHIDVEDKVTHVAMRIDGILQKTATWTRDYGLRFLGAAYAMSDIANGSYSEARYLAARLAPREGRDKWAFPLGLEAIRCQFNPKAFGVTYAVWRLLSTTKTNADLTDLGYEPEQLETLKSFAGREKGLAIIAGPTGSGKSTTLSTLIIRQRALEAAAGRARSCFTIEDPPERRIPGAQQLVVPNTDDDAARATAFEDAIRAALRSDPNIIMVGEIRDLISANLAVTASMTGHQVWSTLHCSTAHAIPIRLTDLGVDRSVIFGADELQVAVGQTLAPLLCPYCKIPLAEAEATEENRELLAFLGRFAMHEGTGCEHCNGTGIKGRTVLAEVIRTDPSYLAVLRDKGIVAAREFCSARGEPSINEIAIRKASRGEIPASVILALMELPSRILRVVE